MHRSILRRSPFTALIVISVSLPILGQASTGSVVGTIYDRTGASVSGAQLVLSDTDTQALRHTIASPLGTYEFLQLSPGIYDLSVEAQGFRHTVERHVVVDVGSTVHLDVTVSLGDVTQTVNVNAEPALVEPDRVSVASTVKPGFIQSLPLQDRQFLNLALMVPGTIPGAPGTRIGGTSIETFSVSGMRSQSNNYTLDGISNNDPHISGPLNLFRLADAVQEFSVETSIPGSDAGRSSGAQVRVVTKSGGNAYHGTLFYYARNDAFDATPFFLKRAGLPKNSLERNQFGGTAGGFIRRDQTFWFASFEGYRQSVQVPATARIPTDAERAAVTDQISKSLLNFWPKANTPGLLSVTGKNWAGTTPDVGNDETYLFRIDQKLATNHWLTARYAWFSGDTLARQNSPFHGLLNNSPEQRSLLVQSTYSTAHLVNQARFGYSSNSAFSRPTDASVNPGAIFTDANGAKLPGFIDTGTDPLDAGLPTITINGLTDGALGVGPSFPQGRTTDIYEFMDDLSLSAPRNWSRHTLHFGLEVRGETDNTFLNAAFRGSISFPGWSAFASGQPQRGSVATGESGTLRKWSRVPVYLYAQDAFRARPDLTFNVGIRWEYPGTLSEERNRGSNFVPGIGQMELHSNLRIDVDPTQFGRAALLETPIDTRLPASGQFNVPLKNFEPFVGAAYSPSFWGPIFAQRTVMRLGFRISRDDIFDDVYTLMGLNPPSVLSTTLPRNSYTWATVLNQNLRLFSPDPTVATRGERGVLTFSDIATNPSTPYSMNYAVELERQLGKNSSLELTYVGSQGRKLIVVVDPNQPTVTVDDARKRGDQAPNQRSFPFPQYSNILQAEFVGTSNFNGLSLVAREQMSRGLDFSASYELSKSLDENSEFFPTDGDTSIYADSKNRSGDYGLSSFDIRNRVIGTFVCRLPWRHERTFSAGTRKLWDLVTQNWMVSGITSFRSGFPFTVRASSDTDFTGLNRWTPAAGFSDRVDMSAGARVVPHNMSDPDHAFDPQVFSYPKAGVPGSVGRNSLIGPHSITQDLAVIREFPVRENKQVQLRVESFNVFNHTNFKLPETRLDQSSVGKIGASYDPRLLQLSARFRW